MDPSPSVAYLMSMKAKHAAWVVGLLGLVGCAEGAPDEKTRRPQEQLEPCSARDAPKLDLAQDGEYGLRDGASVRYGHPPQGGPPFAPFRLRLDGIYGGDHGVEVVIEAFDAADGSPIGDASLTHRFLCANAGPDADHLVAGEIHLRFWDETLESLEGREARIVARVEAVDGTFGEAAYTGPLEWVWE